MSPDSIQIGRPVLSLRAEGRPFAGDSEVRSETKLLRNGFAEARQRLRTTSGTGEHFV